MNLVIVGGHLSPALAVIDELPKDAKVVFIGRKYVFEGDKTLSLEYRTITKQKIPFAEISTGRWQRKFTRFTIPSLFRIPYGFIQSFFILRSFKPDVCLGFGGYLSVPVGIVAFFLGIPLIIHEQTLETGIANRILSIFAKKICISWESSFKYFPRSKTVLTGNPNRHSGNSERSVEASRISSAIRDAGQASMTALYDMSKNIPIIYITGGSSGSHFINALVEGCIKKLLEKFIVVHQTGDAQKYHDFDRLQKLRESLPFELKERYRLTKFVEPENVGLVIKAADLVISRAGINTVTELLFFKKPSLLIPLPSSQKNDQLKNALFLKKQGLGEVFYQDSLNPRKFLGILIEMFDNIDKYRVDSRKRHSGLSRISLHREETESDSGVANAPQNDEMEAAQKIIEVIEYAKKAKR